MKNIQRAFLGFMLVAGLFFTLLTILPQTALAAAGDPPADSTRTYNYKDVPACKNGDTEGCLESTPIVKWINFGVNLFSSIVVLGAALMIVVGGIQYASATDNSANITAAKQKITNAIIGLIAYAFLYAFLQWLIPGGIFK